MANAVYSSRTHSAGHRGDLALRRTRARILSHDHAGSDRRRDHVSSGNLAHGGVRVSEPGRNAISPGRPVRYAAVTKSSPGIRIRHSLLYMSTSGTRAGTDCVRDALPAIA